MKALETIFVREPDHTSLEEIKVGLIHKTKGKLILKKCRFRDEIKANETKKREKVKEGKVRQARLIDEVFFLSR